MPWAVFKQFPCVGKPYNKENICFTVVLQKSSNPYKPHDIGKWTLTKGIY